MSDHGANWTLEDAGLLASENPYTFWKPSVELVRSLKIGDLVKLIFEIKAPKDDDPGSERMWVIIKSINSAGFRGQLDNVPQYIQGLALGDEIDFEVRHIVDSDIDDPVPDPTARWRPRCLVSKSILTVLKKVGYLYRDPPAKETDSGWSFLSGDETAEELGDSKNFTYVSLGAVLRHDDRFVALLDRPPPVAFTWSVESDAFVEEPLKVDN
jgi:hypothetical protein